VVQEAEKIVYMEINPSKGTSRQEVDEGEITMEKIRIFGRHTNKYVREDVANKKKDLGKQHSIEISLSNTGKKRRK
jgi:hypothetical protein